jgi:hypothetical protein
LINTSITLQNHGGPRFIFGMAIKNQSHHNQSTSTVNQPSQ